MPLDTSIAMGVRPVEQPNMLAQMGQMMQLRQAQQGYEEQNALKQALSQGVDINDKATFNRLASINPKLAMDLRDKELQSQKTNAEIGLKRADYLGGAYGGLVKNPTLDNAREILNNAVSLGILTPQHAEQQFATLSADPSKIAEVAQKGVDAAINAKEKLANATQIRGQDLTHSASMASVGATIRGQNLTDARTREGTWSSVIVGDRVMEHNNRTGEWREASVPESTGGTVSVLPPTTLPPATGGGAAAPSTAPQPVAPTNALAPQPAGAAPVANALVQPPAAAAPAPARQPLTTFNPKKVARETTNSAGDVTQYNERGEVIGVVPKAGKPSAAYEKELVTEAKKAEGQKTVQTLVASLADQYKGLLQEGGITSTAKDTLSNIGARLGSSGAGQYTAGFVGTKAQELRDSIAQTRPLIINAIKDSTGMSAQQLNSNVELQNFLKAATDPSLSIEANLKALNNLSKLYGLGKELTMDDMRGNPASTGNIATDPTIDALLKKYK